ncbi:MAG: hypothetical protein HY862_03430 [Chloroflexi bacterium]|nr:hypothetical protein [Chloroflexota bacterium]
MRLTTWSNDDLFRRCQEETEKFRHQADNDTAYCYELLRRALETEDNDAFRCIYQTYESTVQRWVYRTPYFTQVDEEVEFFVNGAFTRLFEQLHGPRFLDFKNVQSILAYLNACTFSAVQDYWRKLFPSIATESDSNQEEDSNPQDPFSLDTIIEGQALWDYIQRVLPDESMRKLAYYCYQLDLKPTEIQALDPRWGTPHDVTVARQRLRRFLRKDKHLAEWLGLTDESDSE